jgi:putative Holliday junction resolvase
LLEDTFFSYIGQIVLIFSSENVIVGNIIISKRNKVLVYISLTCYILIVNIFLDSLADIKASVGKIMSVDFGDVRTGLAICDASRFLASGIGYISPGGIEKTAAAVADAAKENRAAAIVVGLPVNMDGSEGGRAARCRKFARMVKELSGLPVAMFDERMTTMTASRYLNETNTRGSKRKQVIDTLSAQIILQNCLDRLKNM